MRIDGGELEDWKAHAELSGLSVAEWVRRRCSERGELAERQGTGLLNQPPTGVAGSTPALSAKSSPTNFNEPAYKSHEKDCRCGVCDFARKAGVK